MDFSIKNIKVNRLVFWAFTLSLFSTACTAYKFKQVRLDAAVIENRIAEGATNFVIQFAAPDGKKANTPIEAVIYAYYGNSNKITKDSLSGTNNKASSFKGPLILGNNRLRLDSIKSRLQKLPPDKRENAYFLFYPLKFQSGHIVYQYRVIVPGQEEEQSNDPLPTTQPCPPAVCHEQ